MRVVVAADLLVGFEVFAALGDGGRDLAGGVALCVGEGGFELVWVVLRMMEWVRGKGVLTVLPQVTAPWRFSMGAGAASVEAARARVARMEVYMAAVGVESECARKSESGGSETVKTKD